MTRYTTKRICGIFPAGGIAWKTKRAARCGNTKTAERK